MTKAKDLVFKILGLHEIRTEVRTIVKDMHDESVRTTEKVNVLNKVIEDSISFRIGRATGVIKVIEIK